MRLAILLMVHKNLEQVQMLISALQHPDITIFVHADKKMPGDIQSLTQSNVVVLPESKRVDVKWAQVSQVEATLNLIEAARSYGEFDYYWLCSGQDFPLVEAETIVDFLKRAKNKNFINFFTSKENRLGRDNHYDKRNQIVFPRWLVSPKSQLRILKRIYIEVTGGYNRTFAFFRRKDAPCEHFYFGATWWCLNRKTIEWMSAYNNEHPAYNRFYETCLCPDESFFHTLVMLSPYRNDVEDYLHYVDWSEGKSSPRTFKSSDYEAIIHSGKLMARKFDVGVDREILERMYKDRLAEEGRK